MNPQSAVKHTTGPAVWTVPSATTPGTSYTVTADAADGRLSCTCPAGEHGKACWHCKAVLSGLAGRPRIRITQRPRLRHRLLSEAGRDLALSLEV